MTGWGAGNCAPKDSLNGLDVNTDYRGRVFLGGHFFRRGSRLGLGLGTGYRRSFRLRRWW